MIEELKNNTGYHLLTFTALNNVESTQEFDFNLIKGKRVVIKRLKFKWYQADATDGYPYQGSTMNIDGTVTGHYLINSSTQKLFIPEHFAANKHQAGNCTLQFKINDRPLYLNGKMDNLFLNEDSLNLLVDEPVQKFTIKVLNATMIFISSAGALNESDNLGWVCEVGVYVF